MQQSISTTTRTITYDDDGLQRLTSAVESPGSNQSYSYDLAGNRTGVWVNGTPSWVRGQEPGISIHRTTMCDSAT